MSKTVDDFLWDAADLAALGITVLRFTGSEIWRDPQACIADIVRVMRDLHLREP